MAAVAPVQLKPTVDEDELRALNSAVSGFNAAQLIWSSGYLAGLAERATPAGAMPEPANAVVGDTWHIYYATETGNSKRIAEQLAADAELVGLATELHDLRVSKPKQLASVTNAVFVLATHGIGEPPEGTEAFFPVLVFRSGHRAWIR